ncbi:MAG: TonB-dependent receptor [Bacteroidales bacterium]|nr:TonB-dependent receptor [Bacteroidales bacterium]
MKKQVIKSLTVMCLALLPIFGWAQKTATARLEGVVLEKETGNPVEFAFVVLHPSEQYATTDKNGHYSFASVDVGESTVAVTYAGKENIEKKITIAAGKINRCDFEMVEANLRLEEVTVIATQNKAGQSTSSMISRQAMDHIQASSLKDVMALVPGTILSNPDLSTSQPLVLRTAFTGLSGAGSNSYGKDMASLGTAIIMDGAPISKNANLQALAATMTGSAGNTTEGFDLRNISTDNIESIEVIRGVASVEYGDMTSGAVVIKSKAGRSPLSVRAKVNPNSYQAALSKGFSLGKKGGILNLSGDYAHNSTYDYATYMYYDRFNIQGMWTKNFGQLLTMTTTASTRYKKDTHKPNPDDLRSQIDSYGMEFGGTLKNSGTLNINKGWLKTIRWDASFSYTKDHNYYQELLTNAEALHSICVTDGAIISNVAGKDVYDINGNKITNILPGTEQQKVILLPYSYLSTYDIFGKELGGYAQLKADLNKRWDNINNHIKAGLDYRTDGNLGEGKVYDDNTPPFRSVSVIGGSYRKRPYYDIPFIHHIGAFVEDTYTHTFANRDFVLTAGARYDWVNGKSAIQPRINTSLDIIPKALTIRGAYGTFAKAPTAIYLYPEKAYFNFSNYQNAETDAVVSTIRVFDTQNDALEMALNRKAEVGFDLKLFDRYRLSVTAYDELMKNGYNLDYTFDTVKWIDYTQYVAVKDPETDTFVPQLKEYDANYNGHRFASFATPTNNTYLHNRGIEYELDLGRFDDIRTSFYVSGAFMQSTHKSNGYKFDDRSTSSRISANVAVYEPGVVTRRRDMLNTALRVTHNIPQIGFVVTLTTQFNWYEKYWDEYGRDDMFIAYISCEDGKTYWLGKDYNESIKDDPEFKYMFDALNDKRFIVEKTMPTVVFNLNVSKEIGDILTASFFANNLLNNRPLYESKKNPGSFTELLGDHRLFFGFDLKINIK